MTSLIARISAIRRVAESALGQTDRRRWRDPQDPGFDTAERNRLIADLIPAQASVLDLGAGTQQLRHQLPLGCSYQACDLVPGPGILQCDFNADQYPRVESRYDVVVVSGLLEFIRRPETFLHRAAALGDVMLLSYRVRPPGEAIVQRLELGDLSHLTQTELEALLDSIGYRWQRASVYEHRRGSSQHVQPIYRIALAARGGSSDGAEAG